MKFTLILVWLLVPLACDDPYNQSGKIKHRTETEIDNQANAIIVENEGVEDKRQDAQLETTFPSRNLIDRENEETKTETELNDKEKIVRIVHQLYKWREIQDSGYDFDVLGNGERYTSIDKQALEKRLKVLKDSNLFANEFLQNYSQIAMEIDRGLSTGETVYLEGTFPPYGTGGSPWTETQDVSDDAYWDNINIENIAINGNEATLQWFWPLSFSSKGYKMEMVKDNDDWRVSHMERFDINKFFKY